MSDAAVSAHGGGEAGLPESSNDRGDDGERLTSEELPKGGSPASSNAGEVVPESTAASAAPTADAPSVARDDEVEIQGLSPPPQPAAAADPDSASTAPGVCERCQKLEDELEQSRNKELRLRADLENSKRKHLERLKVEVEQSESDLLRQLLPGLDAMDAAIKHHPEVVEPLRVALLKSLKNVGLEVIAPERGQDFDPERHEAVSLEEKDGAEREMVSEVLSNGYIWKEKERVLRAAQVRVER